MKYFEIIPFYIRLNSNCPEAEKIGSGPGSCGGEKSEFKSKATITERLLPNGTKYYTVLNSEGKVVMGDDNKTKAEQSLKRLIKKEESKNISKLSIDKSSKSDKSNVSKSSTLTASNLVTYSDKLLSTINDEQLSAINQYTDESIQINTYLHTGKMREDPTLEKDEIDNIVNKIDSVFKKASIPEDITVYRGITNFELSKMSNSALKVGSKYVPSAFVSTSYDKNVAEEFSQGKNPAILEINLPKGTKAIALENHADAENKSEKEILIARNTEFRVKELKKIGNKTHIVLDAITK